MTTPRSSQIDFSTTPYYHCMSRCVRQAYLCGVDSNTGKDYSHRKQWIVERLMHLSESFFVDICAYAVMSNHYHVVLKATPGKANNMSDNDLLQRWERVFRNDAKVIRSYPKSSELYVKSIEKIRDNLTSISRFMAALNEYIGAKANQEDDVKGRFWSDRFRSQALLDEGAILTAMAYVDLNPVRAKVANMPEGSEHTSIQERITAYKKSLRSGFNPEDFQPVGLVPLLPFSDDGIDFTLYDYLQLIDETSRVIRSDKRGYVSEKVAPLINRIGLTAEGFIEMVMNLESQFSYAVGRVEYLKHFVPSYSFRNNPRRDFVEDCYLELAA